MASLFKSLFCLYRWFLKVLDHGLAHGVVRPFLRTKPLYVVHASHITLLGSFNSMQSDSLVTTTPSDNMQVWSSPVVCAHVLLVARLVWWAILLVWKSSIRIRLCLFVLFGSAGSAFHLRAQFRFSVKKKILAGYLHISYRTFNGKNHFLFAQFWLL